MPGVRVDLLEETTTLDLQEGEGPRRQCGTDGGRAEEKVRACVVCECALVCEDVCLCVGWREPFSEAVVRAWITGTRC